MKKGNYLASVLPATNKSTKKYKKATKVFFTSKIGNSNDIQKLVPVLRICNLDTWK